MLSVRGLALVLTLAVVLCDGQDASGFADSVKDKFNKGMEMAKEGFEKAGDVFNDARDKIGPYATNFTATVKEKFDEGVEKAKGVLTNIRETVTSHVSPFVHKVRTGMLGGVRKLRDKLNKNKTTSGEDSKESGGDSDLDGEAAQINREFDQET